MAFTYTGGADNRGKNTAPTITHGLTINSGDLVVAYVHNNDNSTTISADSDAGAGWNNPLNKQPGSKTCRHSLWWRVANGSEPSSYSWTLSATEDWRVLIKVFGASAAAVVDASVTDDVHTTSYSTLQGRAANGAVISDDAVSLFAAGKDFRNPEEAYTTVDNSYTGVLGGTSNQITGLAHRIYTTGTTFSGDIIIQTTDGNDSRSEEPLSAHISFIESSGTTHNLLADDIQSTSEVSSPAVGQTHALLANDVQATSEISSPAVGQEHALLADDIQSTSEVSAPVLAESHILLADDVQATSEVSSPAIGQTHALLADSVQSTSEISSPAVGQEHALLADDIQSTSEVSAPVLAEASTTDDLLADDVESASQVSLPGLAQIHALLANSVESSSEVSSPVLDRAAATSSNRQFMQNFM